MKDFEKLRRHEVEFTKAIRDAREALVNKRNHDNPEKILAKAIADKPTDWKELREFLATEAAIARIRKIIRASPFEIDEEARQPFLEFLPEELKAIVVDGRREDLLKLTVNQNKKHLHWRKRRHEGVTEWIAKEAIAIERYESAIALAEKGNSRADKMTFGEALKIAKEDNQSKAARQ